VLVEKPATGRDEFRCGLADDERARNLPAASEASRRLKSTAPPT